MDNQANENNVEFTFIADNQPTQERELPPPPLPRGWVEVLLDPKTLQGLMSCGGGLLVLGLVVWLWSIGIFENKLIVAGCLGAANFGLLAAGMAGTRFSRYQTASRATTMLACLVMPLNLWFYHAQGLITLDQGGQLWIPAFICCAIYVLVARLLADPLFVNAIVGGITMTGLLFLAQDSVGRFWDVMGSSTFLVVLGMICIHIERAFPPEEGPFSRAKFGRAFFNAGHVVMGLGLSILLVGRVVGRLYDRFFLKLDWISLPEVATQTNLKLLAIVLALGAAYSYVYSQVVVKAKGRYMISAVLALVWSAIILLDLLQVAFTLELVMLLTAIGALVTSIARPATNEKENTTAESTGLTSLLQPLQQACSNLAKPLSLLTLIIGIGLYSVARVELLQNLMTYDFSGLFVVAAVIGGAACWFTARPRNQATEHWMTQAGILLAWLAVDATVVLLSFEATLLTLILQMLVPLALIGVAVVTDNKNTRWLSTQVAEVLATFMFLTSTCTILGLIRGVTLTTSHLGLTVFFAEVTVCLGLICRLTARRLPAALAGLSLCVATWQLFLMLGVTQYVFVLAVTFLGTVSLGVGAFIKPISDDTAKDKPNPFATVSLWVGRLCISFSSVATLLIALARLLTGETQASLFGLIIAQVVAAAVAGFLAKETSWRRHFWVLATGQALMMMLVLNSLSTLNFLQRGEMFLTVAGLSTLGFGYWGWSREQSGQKEMVSFNLALGSLLSAGPLTLGMLVQRFDSHTAAWGWVIAHEAGVLLIGLLLLGAGILCRIRWSTLVGGSTLLIYVGSLVGLIRFPELLQTTAVYMMIGGGLFFGTAVLLSIYRDRLLAIPKRAKEGEGVFRVLKWR